MLTIRYTAQFKRDYKREKRGKHKKSLDKDLSKAIDLFITGAPLPKRMHDHCLTGNWKDYRDCHIKPDLVLIYRKTDGETLDLVRLGSHSELGL